MKYNYDGVICLIVFCAILVGGVLFASNNFFFGNYNEIGALYFLAAVVGTGLFWIGLNIRKK